MATMLDDRYKRKKEVASMVKRLTGGAILKGFRGHLVLTCRL
ncbi:MAG: hypothetical protein PVG41_05450 [Desulfobacteraceae bacterium]